ncbi:zinc finger CCCH domain-containing protein 3 isoform X1 [Primulina huaijiensis]|uniref:zinc finger CCCH domain-containing protein 3 isoform X1 n=1 Tax=Primulina huaijiensis TaxID=1492673 RepID=UPI003CC77ACB
MPLGKYYCDYCDKEFQDTPAARRRHLQGIQHQRAKAAWYSPQNLNRIHEPESFGKGICNRFVCTGSCQYGDSCKYYHPKDVAGTNIQGIAGTNIVTNVQSYTGVIGTQLGTTLGSLPPSLCPPPEGGYPPLPFIDWG